MLIYRVLFIPNNSVHYTHPHLHHLSQPAWYFLCQNAEYPTRLMQKRSNLLPSLDQATSKIVQVSITYSTSHLRYCTLSKCSSFVFLCPEYETHPSAWSLGRSLPTVSSMCTVSPSIFQGISIPEKDARQSQCVWRGSQYQARPHGTSVQRRLNPISRRESVCPATVRGQTYKTRHIASNHGAAEAPIIFLKEKECNGVAQNETHHSDQ